MSQVYSESVFGPRRTQADTPLQKLSRNTVPSVWRSGGEKAADGAHNQKTSQLHDLNDAQLFPDFDSLKPIGDVPYKLFQTKLKIDAHKKHLHHQISTNSDPKAAEPVYYTPPTSIQSGIQSFLPPNYHGSAFNKLRPFGLGDRRVQDGSQDSATEGGAQRTFNPRLNTYAFVDKLDEYRAETQKFDDEANDEDDYGASGPSGDWFNPVVKQALSRQVNKENEFRKCVFNVVLLILYRLVLSFLTFAKSLVEESRSQAQKYQYTPSSVHKSSAAAQAVSTSLYSIYGYLAKNGIYAFFIFNILLTSYRLVKPQDHCFDLPLTNRQREMLGLEPIHHQDDLEVAVDKRKEKQFETSKYSGTRPVPYESKLSSAISRNFVDSRVVDNSSAQDSSRTDLTYSKPVNIQLSSRKKTYDAREVEEMSKKFKSRYNIDFQYSDEE